MPEESGFRPRVLVVDDEQRLTELLRLELDVEGYDVDIANDGASGLIRSRSEPSPDLIISDGESLCRENIREINYHSPTDTFLGIMKHGHFLER